ncbi:MAG: hypothetical protein SVT56_11135 [Chloroflexota bacterium]|nr:hypothetical protein [Chloroflexota bacterium]
MARRPATSRTWLKRRYRDTKALESEKRRDGTLLLVNKPKPGIDAMLAATMRNISGYHAEN